MSEKEKEIKDLIVEFFFQLNRTYDKKKLEELEKKYDLILKTVFEIKKIEYIELLYKLIGYTRDIIKGKGEYTLSFLQINSLIKYTKCESCDKTLKIKIINMAMCAIESFVRTNLNEHPYGCWKDMKYFCNYYMKKEERSYEKIKELKDPVFNKIIQIIIGQLRCDEKCHKKTLLARWIPREKSEKFGWLTNILAREYYKEIYNSAITIKQKEQATKKCLCKFRKLISSINKSLNTVQIHQCNNMWSKINFEKDVTSITLRKQSKAFQGINKDGRIRYELENNSDRQICIKNYENYVSKCKDGKIKVKGKRISLIDFVRDGFNILEMLNNNIEKNIINAQWNDNTIQNNNLGECIAMIDTSLSMEEDYNEALYAGIGLGLRIAEKSIFGKGVITFSASASWINLENCKNFMEMIEKIKESEKGSNTNFLGALDVILDTAIMNNINPIKIKKLNLVILSDMNIDSHESNKTILDQIKEKYRDAGLKTIYKEAYEIPHIIFWNLKNNTKVPIYNDEKNISLVSGINPVLLNEFCVKGCRGIKDISPWKIIKQILSNDRYVYMEKILRNLLKEEYENKKIYI